MTRTGGALGPVHHPTADFFVCDIFSASPKGDMGTMEHPMFSLSTRPDRRILSYEHNGVAIEVAPSVRGLATIHDKDVLIYCVSQLMAALNAGREIGRVLHLRAHDLLVATNRETSGDSYRRLREAFERLAGTRVTTNYETGGHEVTTGFGLIESWQIVRRTRGGKMVSVSVTLSEWLFRAVLAKSVLTLSRDYFRLRKPLERRVYELARKHCGRQPEWRISVETLLKKSGSASPRRVFRKMLRDMIAAGHLPDYEMDELPGDLIRFRPRGTGRMAGTGEGWRGDGPLAPATLEAARGLMPGADVHALEAEWRATGRGAGPGREEARGQTGGQTGGRAQGRGRGRGRAAEAPADAAFLDWVRRRAGR